MYCTKPTAAGKSIQGGYSQHSPESTDPVSY